MVFAGLPGPPKQPQSSSKTVACFAHESGNVEKVEKKKGGGAGRWLTDLVCGAHAGLVRDVIGPPQLLDGLGWHGLGEAQAAPGVGGGPHLGDHRLLQHRYVQGEQRGGGQCLL